MTNEEAVKTIESLIPDDSWHEWHDVTDAFNLAIKALENQERMQRELKSLDGIAEMCDKLEKALEMAVRDSDESNTDVWCHDCPYGGPKHMLAEAERWPKIAKCYEQAFQRMIDKRKADGLRENWNTGSEVMSWWLGQDNRHTDDDSQISLFGLRLDESSV